MQLEKIINSDLTFKQKLLVVELLTKVLSIDVRYFSKVDLKYSLKYLVQNNYFNLNLESCLLLKPLCSFFTSRSHLSILEHSIINSLLNKKDDCICLYSYLNFIDLFDIFLCVNTSKKKAVSEGLNIKLGSSSAIVKEEVLSNRKKRLKSRYDSARNVVDYFRQKLIEYNNSIDAKTYFPGNWDKVSLKYANDMLKTLDEEEIIGAIDWFFNDTWWNNKITGLGMVSKHYQKYVASKGNKIKYEGLLKKAMENK